MGKNIGWEDYTIATSSEKSFSKQNHKKTIYTNVLSIFLSYNLYMGCSVMPMSDQFLCLSVIQV